MDEIAFPEDYKDRRYLGDDKDKKNKVQKWKIIIIIIKYVVYAITLYFIK